MSCEYALSLDKKRLRVCLMLWGYAPHFSQEHEKTPSRTRLEARFRAPKSTFKEHDYVGI
jgi:hypothetical protein